MKNSNLLKEEYRASKIRATYYSLSMIKQPSNMEGNHSSSDDTSDSSDSSSDSSNATEGSDDDFDVMAVVVTVLLLVNKSIGCHVEFDCRSRAHPDDQ